MKRNYSGQAIAIIMVVLVVATVIGASLYSRMIKNRDALTDTKESSRALEQADSILDLVISSDLGTVQKFFDSCIGDGGGRCEYSTLDQFYAAAEAQGAGGALSPEFIQGVDEWCDEDDDPESNITITIEYAGIEDYQEWPVGTVMALKVGGLGIANGCNLELGFKSAEQGDELFAVKKVYADASGNVKPYEESDILLYCFADAGGACTAPVAPTDSIAQTFNSSSSPLLVNMGETKGSYTLYEVRVLPLYKKIGVSVGVPTCASDSLHNFKVNAKVNCKGDYREKQVIIPNIANLGYPALFDYTIYNATGVLKPN